MPSEPQATDSTDPIQATTPVEPVAVLAYADSDLVPPSFSVLNHSFIFGAGAALAGFVAHSVDPFWVTDGPPPDILVILIAGASMFVLSLASLVYRRILRPDVRTLQSSVWFLLGVCHVTGFWILLNLLDWFRTPPFLEILLLLYLLVAPIFLAKFLIYRD